MIRFTITTSSLHLAAEVEEFLKELDEKMFREGDDDTLTTLDWHYEVPKEDES